MTWMSADAIRAFGRGKPDAGAMDDDHGGTTVICESESTRYVADTPPTVTRNVPVNRIPVTVTAVLLRKNPTDGLIEVTTGTGEKNVNWLPGTDVLMPAAFVQGNRGGDGAAGGVHDRDRVGEMVLIPDVELGAVRADDQPVTHPAVGEQRGGRTRRGVDFDEPARAGR